MSVTLSYWAESLKLETLLLFLIHIFGSVCVEVSSLDDQSGDQFRALVSSSRGIPYRAFRGYGRGCGVEDGHA